MLLLAHTGITLGAATIVADTIKGKPSWFASLSGYLDIRWLLVGSLLPDIIDKPVGQFIFRDTFNNGRIFSHTLLFLIIISVISYLLFKKYNQKWLVALSAGTLAHLVLDSMWQTPQTLFWPLMGFSFPKGDLEHWVGNIWEALFSNPGVYVPEIIGLGVLIILGVVLLRKKKVVAFIKHGEVT